MVIDTEMIWSGDKHQHLLKGNVDCVLGYQLKNIGVLAGVNMNVKHEYSDWIMKCKAVSFGLVFPAVAGNFTM